jgi:hypothetical protein
VHNAASTNVYKGESVIDRERAGTFSRGRRLLTETVDHWRRFEAVPKRGVQISNELRASILSQEAIYQTAFRKDEYLPLIS